MIFRVLLLLLVPTAAFAYVDPGIVPMLFQAGYILFAGVTAFFFIKPWGYIKSTYAKARGQKPEELKKSKTELPLASESLNEK